MADNIKIIGDVSGIRRLSRIKNEDLNLIPTTPQNKTFGAKEDYIQYIVYDDQGEVLYSIDNYLNYKLPPNSSLTPEGTYPIIEINPVKDLEDIGYISGQFSTQYNFNKSVISGPTPILFIDEISEDRTEVRFNSTFLSTAQLISWGQYLGSSLENSNEQINFLLNFPDNFQFLIINVAVDFDSPTPTLLLKLYEPLSLNLTEKTLGWISEEIIEPYIFTVNLNSSVVLPPAPQLQGPNFDIDLDIKQNVATKYESYDSLVSSLTGSSYHKILNYMNDPSYDLNIDYTSFENFIHFSSAKKRLEIFYNKVKQIEDYNTDINILLASNSILKNEETASIKLKIDNIAKNFDGFENYMYFESSSYAWPKTNNTKPYKNKFINKQFTQTSVSSVWNFTHNLNEIPTVVSIYSGSTRLTATQSSTVGIDTISLSFTSSFSGYIVLSSPSTSTWYNLYTGSAELYDENNLDHLYNVIPEYIKFDSANYQPYFNFINMIGHYFDNIWIYITSINELYNADNNLEKGISKDIVYDALKSLGVKLYNSKGDNEFDDYIGGINSGSTLFSNDFSATSSYLNNISKKDLLSELYKRIYHNIPLLSKTKGTKAGLQNLITTFGITSSIFEPKEFGGDFKYDRLKGHNHFAGKIHITDNKITGSVLSPFISLQQSITSSALVQSTDLHFVDLSFSPQHSQNDLISSSIARTHTTFSVDDYIGDPRYMYTDSYTELVQENLDHTIISGSIPYRLDYKGFFELVKYFDNSLFKMLKDFVPARTNPITGISIKSPVLERNKVKSYRPKIEEESIYDAVYDAPVISEIKDYNYNILTGNKSEFYTGEFTGSYANINYHFENTNPNPYLHPSKSIDINEFNHTDFNVTLNNISSSIVSKNRLKLEDIYVSPKVLKSGIEFTSSAELQDSYNSLLGHQRSRYEGTKLSSLTYNNYTSASATYNGDNSYGKTAVIDKNTRKIGLFTQIVENPYFGIPKRNNVVLRYLVDAEGNLTELNKKNKHWEEVQNIFKAGTISTVALFDNQKYSNQKVTDGVKNIYNSGYSYSPILYSSKTDNRLYFNYTGDSLSKLFKISTRGGAIINAVPVIYPITSGNKIFNLFSPNTDSLDDKYQEGNAYLTSVPNTFTTYSIEESGQQLFTANFSIKVTFGSVDQSGSFTFNINKVGSGPLTNGSQTLAFTSSNQTTVETTNTSYRFCTKEGPGDGESFTTIYETKVFRAIDGVELAPIPAGRTFRKISVSSDYVNNSNQFVNSSFRNDTYGVDNPPYRLANPQQLFVEEFIFNNIQSEVQGNVGSNLPPIYDLPSRTSPRNFYRSFDNFLTQTKEFNIETLYSEFALNDRVAFEFITGSGGFNTSGFIAEILPGGTLSNALATNQTGLNPYATSSLTQFVSGSSNNNTIILSSELSYFQNYQFVPSGSNIIKNSLYDSFGLKNGDVNYIFSPKPGDVAILYYGGNGNFVESNIASITKVGGKLNITLTTTLPSALRLPVYSSTTLDKFLILSKINDENNMILSFIKPDGETSLGLIIPNDIHPNVLDNIDIITKEVKQKLIDLGSINSGGQF
jgi:hypothetical protein